MRIGTWNLEKKWTEAHSKIIEDNDCDVWLLTEVCIRTVESLQFAGWNCCHSKDVMTAGCYWSAVVSRVEMTHPVYPYCASVATQINGTKFCSCVLPWSTCKTFSPHPWVGNTLVEMATKPLQSICELPARQTVWGGDWNQNLEGDFENVGSRDMRELLENAIEFLKLQVPTRGLPHRLGQHTIDHIAVPMEWTATAKCIDATNLSDHDAYVVDVDYEWHTSQNSAMVVPERSILATIEARPGTTDER